MQATGLKVKNQIIWNKTIASMGWGDYRWKHEPIFYATYDGKDTQFYGDRSEYTVWNESWDIKNRKSLKINSSKSKKKVAQQSGLLAGMVTTNTQRKNQ